jgi:hypothetical protein
MNAILPKKEQLAQEMAPSARFPLAQTSQLATNHQQIQHATTFRLLQKRCHPERSEGSAVASILRFDLARTCNRPVGIRINLGSNPSMLD